MLLILIRKGVINAAHDVSEGGLWTALVEMGLPRGLGFDVITDSEIRPDAFMFVGKGDTAALHNQAYDFNDDAIPYGCAYFVALVQNELTA